MQSKQTSQLLVVILNSSQYLHFLALCKTYLYVTKMQLKSLVHVSFYWNEYKD